jgi:diadenosine tetraphosphate (Ap4A) HIT family hydrolase
MEDSRNSILYAPWRTEYVAGAKRSECVFCDISQKEELDLENKVLFRDEVCFVVMNRFPYTPGHFMIIPHQHTQNLEDVPPENWLHISKLAQKGVELLKKDFSATGVNIGMNLGESAGAGIAEHIHLHLVPRFNRDTNFITTISHTRIYSTDFEKIFLKFRELAPKYFDI